MACAQDVSDEVQVLVFLVDVFVVDVFVMDVFVVDVFVVDVHWGLGFWFRFLLGRDMGRDDSGGKGRDDSGVIWDMGDIF